MIAAAKRTIGLPASPEVLESVRAVGSAAAGVVGLPLAAVPSPSHARRAAMARELAVHACREVVGASYPAIAQGLGLSGGKLAMALADRFASRWPGSPWPERDGLAGGWTYAELAEAAIERGSVAADRVDATRRQAAEARDAGERRYAACFDALCDEIRAAAAARLRAEATDDEMVELVEAVADALGGRLDDAYRHAGLERVVGEEQNDDA